MAAIPVPSVNTPTYQSWGAAVANKLNSMSVYGARLTIVADNFGDVYVTKPATIGTVIAAIAVPAIDPNGMTTLHRNGDLVWKHRKFDGTIVNNYAVVFDLIIIGTAA